MGVFDGAASGAGAGSLGGPIGAIAGGVLGGIGGIFSGKSRARKAAAQAALNAKLARIDTEYSPFVASKGYRAEAVDSPDVAGAGLSGAFAGGLQGLNVYRGLQGDKMNEEKLNFLKKLGGAPAPLSLDMSGSGGGGGGVYSALKSLKTPF